MRDRNAGDVHRLNFDVFETPYEKARLQFRTEISNVVNHPIFADPSDDLPGPQFGYSTTMPGQSLEREGASGGLNPLYQIGGPRSVQLASRVVF